MSDNTSQAPTKGHNEASIKCTSDERITLYLYTSWENAEKIFEQWELKATIPHQTNDPFEFIPAKNSPFQPDIADERKNPFCLLCFSSVLTSSALWGHYADKHQGVCLEFNFPIKSKPLKKNEKGELLNGLVLFHRIATGTACALLNKVVYSDKRVASNASSNPAINFVSEEYMVYSDAVEKLMSTKDESWAFEQEYRLILSHRDATSLRNGMIFYSPPLIHLQNVYVGIRAKHTVHYIGNYIRKTLDRHEKEKGSTFAFFRPPISVIQMEPEDDTFKLKPSLDNSVLTYIHARD